MSGADFPAKNRLQAILGHYWTLAPRIAHGLKPEGAPDAAPWNFVVQDPSAGPVKLTGLYRNLGAGTPLLVVVHGLGGTASSYYACRAARAAEAAGMSCLRFNLRGAARDGEDFYHAGLVEDLEAVLSSPETRNHLDLYVLGYSLGGHLALRYGCLRPDPRVRALAAVSSPLDLSACANWIDRPRAFIYRWYLLRSLFEMYEKTAARRPHLLPPDGVRDIRSIRAFDEAVVAPRHGFHGAADYYARASAGPLLNRLARP
ncbi:MAG: alpha/beta fold hydrolase, partial [Acidobacteriota bacterium]